MKTINSRDPVLERHLQLRQVSKVKDIRLKVNWICKQRPQIIQGLT